MPSYKIRFLSFFLCLALAFSSCGKIKGWFSSSSKKKPKIEKVETPPAEVPPPSEGTPESPEGPPPIINEVPPPPPSETPPPLEQPPAVPEAQTPPPVPGNTLSQEPFQSFFKWGGKVSCLAQDKDLVYMGMGRSLLILGPDLSLKTTLTLKGPCVKVKPLGEVGAKTLFVEVSGRILQMASANNAGIFEITKSFEAEGPFEAQRVDGKNLLFVFTNDKVKVLDVSTPSSIVALKEISLPSVSQVFPHGSAFYFVQGGDLKIVDKTTSAILASLTLGGGFQILGVVSNDGREQLVVAVKNSLLSRWSEIRYLPLAANGGIAEQGQSVKLSKEVDFIFKDPDTPNLVFVREGVLGFFDLSAKTEVALDPLPLGSVRQVYSMGSQFLAITDDELEALSYTFPQNLAPATAAPTATTPVAPIPQPKGQWLKNASLPLASSVSQVILPGGRSILVLSGSRLFAGKNFSATGSDLAPYQKLGEENSLFEKIKYTSLGTFAFSTKGKGVLLLSPNLSSSLKVDFDGEAGIIDLDALTTPDGKKYVVVAVKKNEGGANLVSYKLDPALPPQKISTLSFNELSDIQFLPQGESLLAACGSVCLVGFDVKNGELKLAGKVALQNPQARVTGVASTPNGRVALAYSQGEGGSSITLLNLKSIPIGELSAISPGPATLDQFLGLTFSKGGEVLLLPDNQGLKAYSLKTPSTPQLLTFWDIGPVNHGDVTDRGATVCAAQGEMGLECASLTFGD